jgi:hypothetical protein
MRGTQLLSLLPDRKSLRHQRCHAVINHALEAGHNTLAPGLDVCLIETCFLQRGPAASEVPVEPVDLVDNLMGCVAQVGPFRKSRPIVAVRECPHQQAGPVGDEGLLGFPVDVEFKEVFCVHGRVVVVGWEREARGVEPPAGLVVQAFGQRAPMIWEIIPTDSSSIRLCTCSGP